MFSFYFFVSWSKQRLINVGFIAMNFMLSKVFMHVEVSDKNVNCI